LGGVIAAGYTPAFQIVCIRHLLLVLLHERFTIQSSLNSWTPLTIYTLTFYAYDNTETNSETFSNQTLGDFGQGVSGTISWTSGYNFTGSTPNGFFSTTLIVESDPHGNLQFNDSSASGPEVVVNGIQIYAGMNGVWPVTADEISPGVLPYISVASYGAIGNGTTDDTASIQAALNAASVAGGGIVVLDALTYNIAGGPTGTNLQIPANVTLSGVWHTPSSVGISPPSAPTAGTTLLVNTPTKNPFITIGDHGTLEGVSILYPNQTTSGTPVPYPYSIQGGTVTIQNVMLWNSYNGIDLATLPSGRHIVRNVYGQPLNIGISIDQSLDIGRIKDIHFWPINSNFLSYTEASAIAIQIAQADWEIIDDLSLNGYRYGLEFNQPAHTPTDPPYGQAKNINIVDCPVGVMINDLNFYGLHISNLSYEGIRPSDCGIDYPSGPSIVGQVYINGASFYGTSLGYGVYWAGGGQISIENSYFGASSQAAFYGSAGAVALTGNTFQNAAGTTTGILISSGCQRALVTGNDYNGEQVTVNAAAASVNGNLP